MGVAAIGLSACGGDGGDATTPPAITATALSSADLAIATRLAAGADRLPAGFHREERPSGVTGAVTTFHVKSTDLDSGMAARFELCAADLSELIGWSERIAQGRAPYSDLVEIREDSRILEATRVPRDDPAARIRHRAFRCAFLDRTGSDLAHENGPAGTLRETPRTAASLAFLGEYLWHFTPYNNADHVVLASRTDETSARLTHVIEQARHAREPSGCDRVEVTRWTHRLDPATGAVERSLEPVRSFRVRFAADGPIACGA
jgi:hypothetical protein